MFCLGATADCGDKRIAFVTHRMIRSHDKFDYSNHASKKQLLWQSDDQINYL